MMITANLRKTIRFKASRPLVYFINANCPHQDSNRRPFHPTSDSLTESYQLRYTVIKTFCEGIQLLIHHILTETADLMMITAGLNDSHITVSCSEFKWLLVSAGNHSICSPNDLFCWLRYLSWIFWMLDGNFSFSLSTVCPIVNR